MRMEFVINRQRTAERPATGGTTPVGLPTPKYTVDFKEGGRYSHYCIDGQKVRRVTTILGRFPDSKDGLIKWYAQRVAQTAASRLKDRTRPHPATGRMFCYFPADEIGPLCQQALDNPEEIKKETADAGTAVHEYVEEWLTAGATEQARQEILKKYCLPPEANSLELIQMQAEAAHMTDSERNLFYDKMRSFMFFKFCVFWTRAKLEFFASEIMVGSRELMFGGRIDILAKDTAGKLILLDFKTSKHVSPSYFSQVAAYKLAFEEMYGLDISRTAIIQCPREFTDKNMGFGVYEFKPKPYEEIFKFLVRTWDLCDFTAANCRKETL